MFERLEKNKAWRFLLSIERFVILITSIAVTIIVTLACVFRYLLDTDLVAYTEYLLPVAFWLYMIGGAYGSYEKSHITADILNYYIPEGKVKGIISIIKNLLTLILGLIFMVWAFQFAAWAVDIGTKSAVWRIPGVVGQASIFVGFLLMSFYHFVHLLDSIIEFKNNLMVKASTL